MRRKEEAFKLDDMKNGVPQNVISVNENQKIYMIVIQLKICLISVEEEK